MFFLGVTRFSLFQPGVSGWNLTRAGLSHDEYREKLYAPERLDPRLKIFSELSVPQLAYASAGYDYKHVLQISKELPDYAKRTLESLADDYEFLEIVEEDSLGAHAARLEKFIREFTCENSDGIFAQFRLDDDDLLGDKYFVELSRYMAEPYVGFAVSFGRGYQAVMANEAIFNFRSLYQPRNSMGLAQIGRVRPGGAIEKGYYSNHARCDVEVPTIVDSRVPIVMSIKHAGQDSFAGRADGDEKQKLTRLMELEPPVDFATVAEDFHCLSSIHSEDKGAIFVDEQVNFVLGTDPQAVRFKLTGPLFLEIELRYSSNEVGADKRFFMSVPFQEQVQWPWTPFQSTAMVVGVPYSTTGVERVPLYLPEGKTIESASFWQSRASGAGNRLNSVKIRKIVLNFTPKKDGH
ncbi:glycosyltransferase [Corynebacterium sp. 20_84]